MNDTKGHSVTFAPGADEEGARRLQSAPAQIRPRSVCDELTEKGYTVVRGVLTGQEIARLKSALKDHFRRAWNVEGLGKHQPNAAIAIPGIEWLFSHSRMLAALRQTLGDDTLIFTGNCDAHMAMLSWWHKDTGEGKGGCFSGNYFERSDCKVYRVGLYLQDHISGNGLSVRKASHRQRQLTAGDIETIPTRAGDIIIFDIRLTHAGQLADPFEKFLLRAGSKTGAKNLARIIKDVYQRILGKPEKLSVFFTYGCQNTTTEEYCRFELAAKQTVESGSATFLNDSLVSRLEKAGIRCHPAMVRPGP